MRTDEQGHACPETLGEYRDLVAALTQGEGSAVKFLDAKIAESPNGRDEVVLAPDSQMRAVLFPMMREDLAGTRTPVGVTRVPPSACPVCGHQMDAATHMGEGDAKPSPGDASVCLMCCTPLVFTAELTIRAMTDEDMAKLDDEARDELARVRMAVARVPRPKGRP